MPRHVALLLLVCASLIGPGGARADPATSLCGVRFQSRADLGAKLRNDKARFFAGERVTTALTTSSAASTLWWLAEPKSRAYPAITCVQKKAVAGRGLVLQPAEADCRGASLLECHRLRNEIRRAKF
jgi:hypothetical protein